MKRINITEGKAEISIYNADIVSRDMPVFYNRAMAKNRDISILLLDALGIKNWIFADPLAGSGVRSIRFLKELKKSAIKNILINDYSDESIKLIKHNLKKNNLKNDIKIRLSQHEANIFIMKTKGFHYIDIDPFGTPNPFLDSAMKKIGREGVLAVTATDTSALCGTYTNACKRKYWAVPVKDGMMHETGIRILIRKVQLIAAQYEKAMIPVLSYSSEHYMRVFFRCIKGKKEVDKVLKQHNMLGKRGPLWLGKLWDTRLLAKMIKHNKDEKLDKFLNILYNESMIDSAGFYNLHAFCRINKLKLRKTSEIKEHISAKGYKAADSHFSPYGIRSDIPEKELKKLFSKR